MPSRRPPDPAQAPTAPATPPAPAREHAATPPRRTPLFDLPEARWAAASLALFALGGLAHLLGAPAGLYWALYLACYACGGWEPALSGLRALRERTLDVDLLMVVAAAGAAAIGQIFDGALLIVIFATSGALEAFATRRTEDSVRGLLDVAPEYGVRVRGDGGEETVPARDLLAGDELVLRPGERVAADATVLCGESDIDEAAVTGEPLPAAKRPGERVYAGTVNGAGHLRLRVDRPAHDSVVARIAEQVHRASRTKAAAQLFIERFEQRYSAAVVVCTLALFTVPLLLGSDLEAALLRAMTFMIVASPCAVVLATMPPMLAAISNAGRHGVLVKSAVVMERLADSTVLALDKTGTLTEGRPQVVEIRSMGLSEEEVLRRAAAAELGSEHPVGAAVVAAARERGVEPPAATGFRALPGRGVEAVVQGRRVQVGDPDRLAPGRPSPAPQNRSAFLQMAELMSELRERGQTAVAVLEEGVPLAVLGLRDTVRADAARAVTRGTALTAAPAVLLTGDRHAAARPVADAAGIGEIRAGLLPQDKADAIGALHERGEHVVFVGDGINDAPAMATAHTGVAMGGAGSALTLQTADAVVVHDRLDAVPTALALARRVRRLVIANLAVAGCTIVALVAWDLFWTLPLPLAVAGHEGSTVLVALNGLRLLREKEWTRASRRGTP